MTKPKLLPCPFCGSATAPKIVSNGIGDYYVRCVEDEDTGDGCSARTSDYRAEHEAIAAKRWNMRAMLKVSNRNSKEEEIMEVTRENVMSTPLSDLRSIANDYQSMGEVGIANMFHGMLDEIERHRSLWAIENTAFGGGRYMPAMFAKANDEMSFREMSLVASSHGYELNINVINVDEKTVEAGEFQPMLDEAAPPPKLDGEWWLVGAWDNEDGQVCACYVRPAPALNHA
ncbi:MAG: Lar family restriction alleviation protein [Bacteroidota bacterium]